MFITHFQNGILFCSEFCFCGMEIVQFIFKYLDEWEHFGVKLELRLSRGGIISSGVLEIRNRKWDMGNRKWDMGLWLLKMRNCLKPNN